MNNITVNKTTYKIKSEKTYTEKGFKYTKWEIVKANTEKTLIYNHDLKDYTLFGYGYRTTMTTPSRVLRMVS